MVLLQPLAFWSDPIILEFAFGMALGWLAWKAPESAVPVWLGSRWSRALGDRHDLYRGTWWAIPSSPR